MKNMSFIALIAAIVLLTVSCPEEPKDNVKADPSIIGIWRYSFTTNAYDAFELTSKGTVKSLGTIRTNNEKKTEYVPYDFFVYRVYDDDYMSNIDWNNPPPIEDWPVLEEKPYTVNYTTEITGKKSLDKDGYGIISSGSITTSYKHPVAGDYNYGKAHYEIANDPVYGITLKFTGDGESIADFYMSSVHAFFSGSEELFFKKPPQN
jgi:hypothetical protein